MRARHTDRLMADVERLACASALWYWAAQAQGTNHAGDPDPYYEAKRESCHDAAVRELRAIRDHSAVLELLRTSSTARRHATHALRRAGLPLEGYDWMPVPGQPWPRGASSTTLEAE